MSISSFLDYSNDEPANGILFYSNEVDVERQSSVSSQSVVYFGRETTLKIRVVLKQYMRKSFKNMLREIKIFSLLEKYKLRQNNLSSLFEAV